MPTDILLARWSGIGDVCMALCAAKAYRCINGGRVFLWTAPELRPLAQACPHVTVLEDLTDAPEGVRSFDLSSAQHGISQLHEVDSFLAFLGLSNVPADNKGLDLIRPAPTSAIHSALGKDFPGDRVALVHPGASDPNRTWPWEHWLDLTNMLLLDGFTVALIGGAKEGTWWELPANFRRSLVSPRGRARFTNLIGCLSLLGTVSAMSAADVLVSADAGPVQLAGATETAIVGLYSVIGGVSRVPFRHGVPGWRTRIIAPNCHHHPCYHKMLDAATWAERTDILGSEGHKGLGPIFEHWCLRDKAERYWCMRDEITPARVHRGVIDLLADMEK